MQRKRIFSPNETPRVRGFGKILLEDYTEALVAGADELSSSIGESIILMKPKHRLNTPDTSLQNFGGSFGGRTGMVATGINQGRDSHGFSRPEHRNSADELDHYKIPIVKFQSLNETGSASAGGAIDNSRAYVFISVKVLEDLGINIEQKSDSVYTRNKHYTVDVISDSVVLLETVVTKRLELKVKVLT